MKASRALTRADVRHTPRFALGLLTLVLACGCQILFGDFSVDEDGEGGASTGVGGRSADVCVDGRYRCESATLLRCVDGEFVTDATCLDANHCDEIAGLCRSCLEGQTRCSGTVLEECSESGQAYETAESCVGGTPLCDPVLLRCVECARGAARCVNGQLESCSEARQWVLSSCANGCEDVTGDSDYCRQCTEPGRTSCTTEGNLITCSAAFLWVTEDCAGACVTDSEGSYCATSG